MLDLSCTKNGQKIVDSLLLENLKYGVDDDVHYSCRRYVLPLLGLESNATTRDHTAAAQSGQKNLVALGNSQAQAVLLEDGSVHCEHELISPIRKLISMRVWLYNTCTLYRKKDQNNIYLDTHAL